MKTITLHQPWASLVAIGAKKIETRSWSTYYRGPLAIHAGMNTGFMRGKNSMLEEPYFKDVLQGVELPVGCMVATCNLVHVQQMSELQVFPACKGIGHGGKLWSLEAQERAFGFYSIGRYMWLLDDIHTLAEPVPVKGSLGLWEWSPTGYMTNMPQI